MPELTRSYCRTILIPPCVLATLAWSLVPAHAQTAAADGAASATTTTSTATPAASSSQGIQEIQITAEHRSTDLQKTPLAISTVSQDTLDKSNVTDLAGLNGTVPSLEITKSSGFENIVTIRGVGLETPENALTTVPGVSYFVDGVYIANTISLDQTLFDLDHIEVMRGPQGALYGQSSTGGAISLVSKQPELGKVSGSGDVSYGTYNLHRERAELNAPVGDTLAVRFSVQQYQHDGFTTNSTLNTKLDDANDVGGKFAVLWQPNDTFSATLTGQWYSADQNGAAQKNVNDPNSDPYTLSQDYPSKFNLDTQLYHLNLKWDLPLFSVKSITAFQGLDHRQQEDGSRSTSSLLGFYDDIAAWNTSLQNYSEELDLLSLPNSRLEWTTGMYAQSQHSRQFVVEYQGTGTATNLSVPNIYSNLPSNLAYGNYTYVERKSYAPFVQGTYHVTNDFRVTMGARYNFDAYSLHAYNFSANGTSNVSNRSSNRAPTGRFELDYDLTPKSMIYASVSRGYKPGGLNGAGTAAVVQDRFKEETNTAYEVGSKNTFLDNRLKTNLAAFYYVYKNMQYIESDPVPYTSGIANIPSTHIWGGEMEASYLAMKDRLHLGANLTLEQGEIEGNYSTIDSTKAKNIEASNAACLNGGAYYSTTCWAAVIAGASTNLNGNSPAKMPTVSGSVNASYDFAVPKGTLTPRIEYVYRGDMWGRIFNVSSLDQINAYGVLNLHLLYVPDDSNFTFSLAATNVTNVAGVNSKYTDYYGTYQTSVQYIPPMQVVGTVAYNF